MEQSPTSHLKLLALPLFQGITQQELHKLAAHARFHFQKLNSGITFIKEGEACKDLFFVLQGKIEITTSAANNSFMVKEWLETPSVIQPERLLGLSPWFSSTYTTQEKSSILSIDKESILSFIEHSFVFRINFMNILSTRIQKMERQQWRPSSYSLRERVIRFFEQHVYNIGGEKIFFIKMITLAKEMNVKRIKVSNVLNELQNEHLLKLERGRIIIPALEKLIQKAQL